MTHSDMGVRAGSGKLVGHRALRRPRNSSLEVTRIDRLRFVPSNFQRFDDHCLSFGGSVV
jgi:hypothetical protein